MRSIPITMCTMLLATSGCIQDPAQGANAPVVRWVVHEGCGVDDVCARDALVPGSDIWIELRGAAGFASARSHDPAVIEIEEMQGARIHVRAHAVGLTQIELAGSDGALSGIVPIEVAKVDTLEWGATQTVAVGASASVFLAALATGYGTLGGRGGIRFDAAPPVTLLPCTDLGYGYEITDCADVTSDTAGVFDLSAQAVGASAASTVRFVAPEDYAQVNLAVTSGQIAAVLYTADLQTIVGGRCDWVVEDAGPDVTWSSQLVPVGLLDAAWDTLTLSSPQAATVTVRCLAAGRELGSAVVDVPASR